MFRPVLVLAFLGLSACNSGSMGSASKVSAGTTPLSGTFEPAIGVMGLGAQSVTCTAPVQVKIFEVNNAGEPVLPAIKSTSVGSDGQFTLRLSATAAAKVASLAPAYILEVEGCDHPFSRYVTGLEDQKISNGTSVAYFAAKALAPTAFLQTSLAALTELNDSLVAEASDADVKLALTNTVRVRSAFNSVFGVMPETILESPPQAVVVSVPTIAREREAATFQVKAFHIDPDFVSAFSWTADGTVLASGSQPQVSWTPGDNQQGSREMVLKTGRAAGDGSLDLAEPTREYRFSVNVANNYPPVAPALSLVSATPSKVLSTDLEIATGASKVNCSTFSKLAISESALVAPILASDYNIDCTTAIVQSVNVNLSAADGTKTLALWARDSSGNVSAPTSVSVTLDRTPPDLQLTVASPLKGGANSNVTITASDVTSGLSALKLQVAENGTSFVDLQVFSAPLSGSRTYTWAVPALDVTVTRLKLLAEDSAGNTIDLPSSVLTIDSTPPVLTLTNPSVEPAPVDVENPTIEGACETGRTVNVAGGGLASVAQVNCVGGVYSATVTLAPGSGTKAYEISQADAAGNTATLNKNFQILIDSSEAEPVYPSGLSVLAQNLLTCGRDWFACNAGFNQTSTAEAVTGSTYWERQFTSANQTTVTAKIEKPRIPAAVYQGFIDNTLTCAHPNVFCVPLNYLASYSNDASKMFARALECAQRSRGFAGTTPCTSNLGNNKSTPIYVIKFVKGTAAGTNFPFLAVDQVNTNPSCVAGTRISQHVDLTEISDLIIDGGAREGMTFEFTRLGNGIAMREGDDAAPYPKGVRRVLFSQIDVRYSDIVKDLCNNETVYMSHGYIVKDTTSGTEQRYVQVKNSPDGYNPRSTQVVEQVHLFNTTNNRWIPMRDDNRFELIFPSNLPAVTAQTPPADLSELADYTLGFTHSTLANFRFGNAAIPSGMQLLSANGKVMAYPVLVRYLSHAGTMFRASGKLISDLAFVDLKTGLGPGLTFYIQQIERGVYMNNIVSQPRAGSVYPLNSNSDGMQIGNSGGDLWIDNITFTDLAEDPINIYAPLSIADEIEVVDEATKHYALINRYAVGKRSDKDIALSANEVIGLFQQNHAFWGPALVLSQTETVGDASNPTVLRTEFISRFSIPAAVRSEGMQFRNLMKQSARVIVENSIFTNTRGNGVLVQGPNVLIRNNQITNARAGGICLRTDYYYYSGAGSSNSLIEDNTLTDVGFSTYDLETQPISAVGIYLDSTSTKAVAPYPIHQKLTIRSNTIVRPTAGCSKGGILTGSSGGVSLTANTCTP